MSIMAKLTLRHLLENRKRTVVTILGIATATALISAILLGAFSFFKFFGYLATRTDGNVHAAFYELTKEQVDGLRSDDRLELIGVSDRDPKISGVKLASGKEDRFRTDDKKDTTTPTQDSSKSDDDTKKTTVKDSTGSNDDSGKGQSTSPSDGKGQSTQTTAPKTGDESNVTLWVILMLAAACAAGGLGIFAVRKVRRRR